MFLPLTVTLVSAPGLAVFLVARSSFFTWATASIKPLNKRAPNRIRFISDVVPFSREYTTRAAAAPAGLQVETAPASRPTFLAHPNQENSDIVAVLGCVHEVHGLNTETPV